MFLETAKELNVDVSKVGIICVGNDKFNNPFTNEHIKDWTYYSRG